MSEPKSSSFFLFLVSKAKTKKKHDALKSNRRVRRGTHDRTDAARKKGKKKEKKKQREKAQTD